MLVVRYWPLADMTTAEMDATKLSCRMRCFGLPLHNAVAREASALRLGLLLVSREWLTMSAFGPKRTFPYVAFDVAFGGKADIG
jgi:hypothetical protein